MLSQHKARRGSGWGTVYVLQADTCDILKYGASRCTDLSDRMRSARIMFDRLYGVKLSFSPLFAVCTKDPFGVENAIKWALQDTYNNPDNLVPLNGEFVHVKDSESSSHVVRILKAVSYGWVG